jgi:hypothetical protein
MNQEEFRKNLDQLGLTILCAMGILDLIIIVLEHTIQVLHGLI